MKTKEDREQARFAIMRWETETGPTGDKNNRLMETKEDRKQDRLAIMRWETETGPTDEKNKRPGLGLSKAPCLRNFSYRKLLDIRIVGITAEPGRTVY